LEKSDAIQFYDPGLKEGRVGFFCSDCKDALFASIQLWSDKCKIKKEKI